MDRSRILVFLAPAVALLPMMAAPLPILNSHPAVEIAGYYQSLGLLSDGLASYTYLTPLESYSALHLHSILSAPLLALGYTEGGRLVTLAAAIVVTYLVYRITDRLVGSRVALLAPALLWVNPIFVRLSGRWWPETLGIALTAGALYAALLYIDTDERRWYALSVVLLAFSITNHMWEASIALPLTAVLAYRRRFREAVGIVVTTVVTVSTVWWATHLQPSGASTLTHFGLHNDPTILLSLDWWNYIVKFPIHPAPVARTFILPTAIILLGYCVWRYYVERDSTMVILSTWLISGILIPIALPLGADNHVYYLWAVLAPMSVALCVAIDEALSRFGSVYWPNPTAVSLGLCGVAICYILVFEVAILSGTALPVAGSVDSPVIDTVDGFEDDELKEAGLNLRKSDVNRANEISFVGEWGRSQATQYYHLPAVSRILVYGNVEIRGRGLSDPGSPTFSASAQGTECRVMVIRDGGEVSVRAC